MRTVLVNAGLTSMRKTTVKWLLALAMATSVSGAIAADIPGPPPVSSLPSQAETAAEAQLDYLRGRAALLALRARFDVFDRSLLADQLLSEQMALARAAPDGLLAGTLEDDLVTEISYYLVSLRYLIAVGGAVWPADRPESDYVNDALVHLDAVKSAVLSDEFVRTIDPIDLLQKLEAVYWWTNGEATIPVGESLAEQAAGLVDGLLQRQPLQATT